MPKDREDGATELPRTLKRSDKHAQEIWLKTHDSAVETYGEGRRAHMTAYASLKHSYEKRGDRWVPKKEKGPSDPQARRSTETNPPSSARKRAPTAGGKVARTEKEAREKGREARREYARDRREKIKAGRW
jgi:cation transport regulator ChaB